MMNSLNKVMQNFRSNKYDDFYSYKLQSLQLTFEQTAIVCKSNVKNSTMITPKSEFFDKQNYSIFTCNFYIINRINVIVKDVDLR